VFFAEANKIPNLLHEVGEITFREEEGTNESIDLDKFDQYHHLSYGTMMQKNCRSISNGIRLRNLSKHGIEGFYLNELFVLSRNLMT
jgi:hypothetical protein